MLRRDHQTRPPSPEPSGPNIESPGGEARFPWRVPAVAALVLGAHGVGLLVDAYARFERLDDVMHALGGFLTAWGLNAALPWVAARGWLGPTDRRTRAVLVFGLVAVVAVIWECFEFGCDLLVRTGFQGSTFDTMSDLILGLSGGAAFLALSLLRNRTPAND